MAELDYKPGSVEDFDRLYRSSFNRILYTIYGILGDRSAAEDCTHDAFVRAFKAWKNWKPDAPAEAWLHRIAINVAYSHLRQGRLREVGELVRRLGRPGPSQDPAQLAEGSELFRALRKLPPDQAAAVVLRHHHGYTNREIAIALGAPESTIASRLAKAKERLRAELMWAKSPESKAEDSRAFVSERDARVVLTDGPIT
ncbi:MAG TPA: sigma-70 family RNA polymerase sigma factor [Candidatus Limnocylindria bacterium]|jgi:RNA polymerase sigma-70 factor (ECF subfamily)|nr:sigma-70 family RNA polymerase sigma factor [Candidatus Limnocylindria bacterium]